MLFTKTGTEKVNVSNQHGVRSAQCSSDFDVIHEKTPITINLNISQVRTDENIIIIVNNAILQGVDKTWVQDAPQRILYQSIYSAKTEEEDGKEQLLVIVLSSFFVLVLVCISYDLYRTDKKYRQRKEYETDASILLSKQQAAILQENSKPVRNKKTSTSHYTQYVFSQANEEPKPPINQNGKVPLDISNGTTVSTVNGNKRKSEPDINVILEEDEDSPTAEETSQKPLKRVDSKDKQKRISFRGEKLKKKLLK